MTIKKVVLTDFEGDWTVDRLVVHGDGLRARFTGNARWAPVQDGMQFSESGRLKIPGQAPMEASQSYFWDHDLNIWFSDGRFFHTVPAKGGVARHWCDPDQYTVRYRFGHRPRFETLWRVSGPRKNYAMLTRFERA